MTHPKILERRRFPFNRVAERKQFNCLCEHRWVMAKYFPNSDLLRVFPLVTALEVTHPKQSVGSLLRGSWTGQVLQPLGAGLLTGVLTPGQVPRHKVCPPASSARALHASQPISLYRFLEKSCHNCKIKMCHCPHFTDRKIEALVGDASCPKLCRG